MWLRIFFGGLPAWGSLAFSQLAKRKIIQVVVWLSGEKSEIKLKNIEKNLSRIISLIAVIVTLIATISKIS